MQLQVGVKVLLRNNEKKYLLVRRSLLKYPEVRGRWDIVGGRIDPGKTLIENLTREVKEETGLTLVQSPILLAAQDILRGAEKHVVRLTYIGSTDGEVVLDTEENDMFRWCSWEEFLAMDDVDIYLKELLDKHILLESVYEGLTTRAGGEVKTV